MAGMVTSFQRSLTQIVMLYGLNGRNLLYNLSTHLSVQQVCILILQLVLLLGKTLIKWSLTNELDIIYAILN